MISRRLLRVSGMMLLALSALLLVVAALMGDLRFHLILIIPVIEGTGPVSALGGLSLFLGVILFLSSFYVGLHTVPEEDLDRRDSIPDEKGADRGGKWGGVILVGPIPIVFGSGWNAAFWATVFTVLILIALAIFLFL